MDWKRKFSKVVLDRGMSYYTRKYVKDLAYNNLVYTAKVIGSNVYRVEIKIRKDDIVYMSCSCPHAAKGYYCKHMAAVMYAIEDKGESMKQMQLELQEKQIHPFDLVNDTYRYFDMGRIAADLLVPESRVEQASRLIQERQVVLDEVSVGYHNFLREPIMSGIAYGRFVDNKGERQITCIFDRNRILQAECGTPGCNGDFYESYSGRKEHICSHLLALLFLADDYLKNHNPGDTTDPAGNMLLYSFRNQQAQIVMEEQIEKSIDFCLEPVLEKDRNGLFLSLRAGTDKLYVVKNISDFIGIYDVGAVITFGTKTEIDLAKHRICAESEELYEFVQHIVTEEQSRMKHAREVYNYYYSAEEIKQRIPLYGKRLDRFYDLYAGNSVACTDKSGRNTKKTSYVFKEGKPNFSLKIEKDVDSEETFHGVHVSGKVPDFIHGGQYQYYFTKDAFCRISEESARDIKPLLELGEYGDISFHVGRKNLSEFYHVILPLLKQNVKIKEDDAEFIQQYIPPEAVFAFYLDMDERNVVCKAQARYGEEKVSLLDKFRGERGYELFRNLNREKETLYQIQKYFSLVDLENDELRCEDSEEALLRLLDGGVDRLMALGEVHTTERFRGINIRKKPKIKVGVSMKSDIMNLSVSSEDINQEELLQLLESYQRKKKYYRLKDGDLIYVSETDMEMLQQMMEAMQLSPKELVKGDMRIPMYRALYLNKMLEQSEHIYLNRDKYFKNLIKEFKTVDDSEFVVPESLTSLMRGYQIYGFKWLKTLEHYGFGGVLADDMGLGKTLQAISVLVAAKESGRNGTSLIVSPASLVYNWKEEFGKFAPELKVSLAVGNQQERAEIIANYRDSDVLVTSYDLLKRDIAEYEDTSFMYQILDEAQYIKNHGTAAAKSVKVIKSRYRLALTGTPIENRLSELWSIFDYLMPGFLYGYETFRKELETPIVKYKDEMASTRLKRMVSPFILRRLKGNVLSELPDKLEEIRYAKLETEQQKLYDGQVVHMKEMLAAQKAEDFQKNKLQILAELTRIRQICCDPELLFEKYTGSSAKREACLELIQSAISGEHKMLVFSQFTSMLELLEHDLKRAGINYYKIIGDTPKQKRVEMVNAFNSDNTPVFLISLKAGGTGLNLTGADVVIHYDPWWNQAVQNQATDRAHRIGQSKTVSVYKLIVKNTIEEKIVKMQENKKDLADAILSGENGSITQMSKEELMELLEG